MKLTSSQEAEYDYVSTFPMELKKINAFPIIN